MDKRAIYSMIEASELSWSVRQFLDHLSPQLQTVSGFDDSFLNHFLDLIDEASKIAPLYDYKDIPCNGWRSFLRFNNYFFLLSLDFLKRKELNDVVQFMQWMSFYLEGLIKAHKLSLQGQQSEEMNVHHQLFSKSDEIVGDVMKMLLNKRYFALNYPRFKFSLNIVVRTFAQRLHSSYIIGSKYWLMPFSSIIPEYIDNTIKADTKRVSKMIGCVDEKMIRISSRALHLTRNLFKSTVRIKEKKITVKSQYLFAIDEEKNATVLTKPQNPPDNRIKFRVLHCGNRESGQFANKLALYIHGGGFVGPSAAAFEDIFIKDWLRKLPGCTIVNLEYPLSPKFKFPLQIQTVLDFYIWLTSGEKVVDEILGFKPDHIVICGESAGANLTASLLVALNDIKRLAFSPTIKMPKAVGLFFGVYDMSKKMTPSLLLASTDCIISYPVLKSMMAVARFRIREDTIANTNNNHNSNNNKNKNNNEIHSNDNKELEASKKWKLTHLQVENYQVMTDDSIEVEPTPYLQPLLYNHFDSEDLKSVHLFILGIDFCPFLDQSVTLAKTWKGPLTFEHVDDACHGGFFAHPLQPSAGRNLMTTTVDMIKKALSSNCE